MEGIDQFCLAHLDSVECSADANKVKQRVAEVDDVVAVADQSDVRLLGKMCTYVVRKIPHLQ